MAYEAAGSGLEVRGRGPDASPSLAPLAPSESDFTAVCASHRARVLGLCRRLLRSEADAEDAMQEVMLRAFRAWPRFRVGTDPWPWLAAITANVCHDAGRREVRTAAHIDLTVDAHADTAAVGDAYDEVERRGHCELLRAAMAKVPATYRTQLYLRDIEGWSVADIARLRGRSIPAVRSSLSRARKLLLQRVEELAKTRKEWSLPAAIPLIGRLRARIARARAGIDRAAVGSWPSMDAVITTIGSGRLRGWSELAATAVAAAAMLTIGAPGHGVGDNATVVPAASRPAAAVASLAAASVEPAASAGVSAARVPGAPRPRETTVVIGDAEVDSGRTATPVLTATPGDTPLPPEAEGWQLNVGPAAFDCRGTDERHVVVGATCGALQAAFATP